MRLFFKYIFSIVLMICFAGYSIQFLSDYGLRKWNNTNYNDWENIISGQINSDIIINGSSRGYVGYNPIIIGGLLNKSCFNIAFDAGGYYLQQSKFDIYLKKNIKPKIIIQNIDLAHFNKNVVLPNESQFIPFVNYSDINYFITKYDTKFYYLRYTPLLKYNQNLKLLKHGLVANFSDLVDKNAKTFQGYCPQNRIFKVDYHNLKNEIYIDKKSILKYKRLLNEIVDFYFSRLDNNAKVIFVWAPEYKLRLTNDFELKRKAIINEMNLIQKKHRNFYFIDMAYDEIANDNKYYYDTFHLNELGSNVFSKKLSVKINKHLN
ncbi:hypothetical protein GCM10008015_31980 [Flavobacterium palustre]|uniref:SGNH/GDSL hydrolase family protein n=1 Tax=Flavobacterium palustre TaxID=1476463 RepID=A0ABQ1HTL1_9FLAO|nr:hypothetical protein [Flavobacterium palustre]GGA89095.1 hypothetical protein GCM10008015_31980 [Flavobacterium palustre]